MTSNTNISLFTDEYRTPIFVNDICNAIITLMNVDADEQINFPDTFNLGGPDRVSRIRFCHMLAEACGLDADAVVGKCVNDEYGAEEWEAGSVVTPVKIDELKLGYPRARDVSLVCEEIEKFGVVRTRLVNALDQMAEVIGKEEGQ
eukprot:TRINITY_DN374_c2_g1_i7.p1 TRINITY_DN374_c2_g1~~TRINITY_DN374_c2_g1_i7.p1  ORF type:complete len:146 (-),score=44.93 TRINITY_DN374_c2_g1_i7:200-637(-)